MHSFDLRSDGALLFSSLYWNGTVCHKTAQGGFSSQDWANGVGILLVVGNESDDSRSIFKGHAEDLVRSKDVGTPQ
jgi:hypothetical protein